MVSFKSHKADWQLRGIQCEQPLWTQICSSLGGPTPPLTPSPPWGHLQGDMKRPSTQIRKRKGEGNPEMIIANVHENALCART